MSCLFPGKSCPEINVISTVPYAIDRFLQKKKDLSIQIMKTKSNRSQKILFHAVTESRKF